MAKIGWIVIPIGILLLVGSGFGLMTALGVNTISVRDVIQGEEAGVTFSAKKCTGSGDRTDYMFFLDDRVKVGPFDPRYPEKGIDTTSLEPGEHKMTLVVTPCTPYKAIAECGSHPAIISYSDFIWFTTPCYDPDDQVHQYTVGDQVNGYTCKIQSGSTGYWDEGCITGNGLIWKYAEKLEATFRVYPLGDLAEIYDTDNDGVVDSKDECLTTMSLMSAFVDEDGCVQYIDDETGTASEYVPEENKGFQWDTKAKLGAVLIGLGTILVFLF